MKTFAKNLNMRGRRCFLLENEHAFTLVEMMVVMGIIAVIFTLGASGMYTARKQTEVLAAAREFQSNIRLIANNSISVASDLENTAVPAKAWTLSLQNGSSAYSINSYWEDTIEPIDPVTKVIKPSNMSMDNPLNNITISATFSDGTTFGDSDYFFLVFSSPFARFTGVKTTSTTFTPPAPSGPVGADDPPPPESEPITISYPTITKWADPTLKTKEVVPANSITPPQTIKTGTATFIFSNGNSAQNVNVEVDLETGESTIQ